VQSQIGSSLWKADPDYKVQFLLLVKVPLYRFHRGCPKLDLSKIIHIFSLTFI
jgi:hypothetical protein